MSEEIEKLDRRYKDWRGVVVHVVGYDRSGDRVIYKIPGYEPECAYPVNRFKSKFERVEDEPTTAVAPNRSDP
ncbi:MAG: DUF4222 domain-containing protein [Ewingella sp.]